MLSKQLGELFFKTKLDKIAFITFSLFLLLIMSIIFLPPVRELIIKLGAIYKGRTLNNAHWHKKIIYFSRYIFYYIFSAYIFIAIFFNCKKNNTSYQKTWCAFSVACIILIIIAIIFFGGEMIAKFLFRDRFDTGMDYFNSIPKPSPHYPALSKLFYKVNHYFMKDSFFTHPSTPHYYRLEQSALIPFMFLTSTNSLAIIFLGTYIFGTSRTALFKSCLILSCYSVLFAIERGNIVYQSFPFLLFFILFYNSKNKIFKELALISLAISFGLKYYPIIFGALLLLEKKWKDTIRCFIYTLIVFFVPEIILKVIVGGDHLRILYTISSIIGWMLHLTHVLMDNKSTMVLITIITFCAIIFSLLVFVLIKTNKNWIRLYILSMLAITIAVGFQYPYTWLFFIPSFLFFMKEETDKAKINLLYFYFMLIIHLPLPIFGYFNNYMSLIAFIKVITTIILTFIIISHEIYCYKRILVTSNNRNIK